MEATERVVRKRFTIMRGWSWGIPECYALAPGKLKKYNLACQCTMCKMGRRKYDRAKENRNDPNMY